MQIYLLCFLNKTQRQGWLSSFWLVACHHRTPTISTPAICVPGNKGPCLVSTWDPGLWQPDHKQWCMEGTAAGLASIWGTDLSLPHYTQWLWFYGPISFIVRYNGSSNLWFYSLISSEVKYNGSTTSVVHIDGSMQERRSSSVLAMELHLSCTNPSICWWLSTTLQHLQCISTGDTAVLH